MKTLLLLLDPVEHAPATDGSSMEARHLRAVGEPTYGKPSDTEVTADAFMETTRVSGTGSVRLAAICF